MPDIIDLRSDTVTRPTAAMKQAMMKAPVGDDVFGEDPTVLKLESHCAAMFGMEAGLFFPSGTQSNQAAIKAQTQPLEEILCEWNAHIYQYENAGYAFHSGCAINPVVGTDGKLSVDQVLANIKPNDYWLPTTSFLSIENSCNRAGGGVYELEEMKALSETARANGLVFHLDGARLFNALDAINCKPSELSGLFDSISICLSKGLGAPVGSVLLCSAAVRERARKIRKVMGGGMRQAGILAAAGLHALEHHVPLLSEDHRRAREIKTCLDKLSYVNQVLPGRTNILIFDLVEGASANRLMELLGDSDIMALAISPGRVRFVTHLDFNDEQLERLTSALEAVSLSDL